MTTARTDLRTGIVVLACALGAASWPLTVAARLARIAYRGEPYDPLLPLAVGLPATLVLGGVLSARLLRRPDGAGLRGAISAGLGGILVGGIMVSAADGAHRARTWLQAVGTVLGGSFWAAAPALFVGGLYGACAGSWLRVAMRRATRRAAVAGSAVFVAVNAAIGWIIADASWVGVRRVLLGGIAAGLGGAMVAGTTADRRCNRAERRDR